MITSLPEVTTSTTRRIERVNLLLLEDAPGDIDLFTRFVEGEVNIAIVSNGAEALDRLFCRGRFRDALLPDVFVCDLNVPLLDGNEVLNVIRSNSKLRRLPIVVWSGSENPDDVKTAYDLGACAYMVKSVNLHELEAQLMAFSKFWLKSVRFATA